ncbi:hypothetical protein NQ036_06800 [Brevibacterium sp. 91QC2O2]|uniref:phage tail tube protein n=1 Tax=Brevibacterium sp. 91QC2O2 TaxID=2968458 RepID=UPI00211CFFEE|nr:hypothetical protein [Brevibacterium sp. 91QC2O2]MCQ9367952.1 hypothetical protein [Brevibacterium sp. 91QC2O2]
MAEIPSTPADGNTRVDWVPKFKDYTKPTVAELTAEGALEASNYFTGDGWNPTSDQASIPDRRLNSRQEFNRPGTKTPGLSVTVIDNTNTTDPNKAVETFVEGANGYFVERRGVDSALPWAKEQTVRIFPVTMGEHQPVAIEANSVTRTTIPTFIRAEVVTVELGE